MSTDFLYPFLERDERDATALLDDLARSAEAKATDSAALTKATLSECAEQVRATALAMAERFDNGGRVFTFGNGGSATDAAGLAALFVRAPGDAPTVRGAGAPPAPPPADVRPLPARSLVADESVLTALANDVGFELVFSRQLIAFAQPQDIAFGLSTSGNSPNVIRAFEEAKRRGLLTVGLAGYSGGAMAACDALDHCIVVRSDSVHRVQEAQAAVGYALWAAVHEALTERDLQ